MGAQVFRAMEQDLEGYQKPVRMVMQEAKRGSLRNIHGPVSRLIRTEDNFAVAIEIALGAAMQQIVVDSEQDAKAMIDAGASLVEIYSGFVYEGPALVKRIIKYLENNTK